MSHSCRTSWWSLHLLQTVLLDRTRPQLDSGRLPGPGRTLVGLDRPLIRHHTGHKLDQNIFQLEKGSIDEASLNQNYDALFANFEDIANVVVGSHWTEFSNEYGSCATNIGTATDPAKR